MQQSDRREVGEKDKKGEDEPSGRNAEQRILGLLLLVVLLVVWTAGLLGQRIGEAGHPGPPKAAPTYRVGDAVAYWCGCGSCVEARVSVIDPLAAKEGVPPYGAAKGPAAASVETAGGRRRQGPQQGAR